MGKEITINVTAPEECTEEQFQEWVEYCLGARGDMKLHNPLCGYDLETESVDIN